jgi:hypothetical protein
VAQWRDPAYLSESPGLLSKACVVRTGVRCSSAGSGPDDAP